MKEFNENDKIDVSYVVSENFISLVVNNKPFHVSKGHKNFSIIQEKLKNKDYENIIELVSEIEALEKKFKEVGTGLKIINEKIYYNKEELNNSLVNQIIMTKNQGYEFDNLFKFLENLMENTSKEVQEELYDWINASGVISITNDGCFLAYKKVLNNYKDIYTGEIDNSIGCTPKMKRDEVDSNRNEKCSRGLHFCSWGYLNHYGNGKSDKVIIVKINPKNVVSIPIDYNNQKGRCCEYEVVGEVTDWQSGNKLTKTIDDYKSDDGVIYKKEFSEVVKTLTTKDMTNIYNFYYGKNIKHLRTKGEAIEYMKKIYYEDNEAFFNYIGVVEENSKDEPFN